MPDGRWMMHILRCVLLKKKHGLEMGRKIQSNIKHLRGNGTVGVWLVKCRLHVATSGIQGSRGVSHHLIRYAIRPYNQ